MLKYGLKCFAGICVWRNTTDEEKTITCGKHEGGVIEYGILKEIGLTPKEEPMIELPDGRKFSASTIQEALKRYVNDPVQDEEEE